MANAEMQARVLHAGNVHEIAEIRALQAELEDLEEQVGLVNAWLKQQHPELLQIGDMECDEPWPVLVELLRYQSAVPAGAKCRVCGCTADRACPGGCFWVESNLCSKCAPAARSIIIAHA